MQELYPLNYKYLKINHRTCTDIYTIFRFRLNYSRVSMLSYLIFSNSLYKLLHTSLPINIMICLVEIHLKQITLFWSLVCIFHTFCVGYCFFLPYYFVLVWVRSVLSKLIKILMQLGLKYCLSLYRSKSLVVQLYTAVTS